MAIEAVTNRPQVITGDIERIFKPTLTEEEKLKGKQLLEEQAKLHGTSSKDVLSNLDLPVEKRADVYQGFIKASDGQISPSAMRFTLKLPEEPFNHHFGIFMRKKLVAASKSA